MTFDPQKHHRRSRRLQGYNYADDGAYFVTICVEGRQCLFGDVVGEQCILTEAGKIVADSWNALPQKYPQVEVDEFIVMPNHIHAILFITDVGAGSPRPASFGPKTPRPTLGQSMGFYKYQTTVEVNRQRNTPGQKLWQRNYYDHIIRNDRALDAIREYIHTNAERWEDDVENSKGTGRDDMRRWVDSLMDMSAIKGGQTPPLQNVPRLDCNEGGETPPLRNAIDHLIRVVDEWENNV